jgi:phosphate butyryltransferase
VIGGRYDTVIPLFWRTGNDVALRNFDQIIRSAKACGARRVGVACAYDSIVLESLDIGEREGIVQPILFGDRDRIAAAMAADHLDRDWPVVHVCGDDRAVANAAIAAVRNGEAQLLVKGRMHTAALFKSVLDKSKGLPRTGTLSHIVFIESTCYHKLFAMTDGGLNRFPDFETKKAILVNAVRAFRGLGCEKPKVALLSYVETAPEGCEETSAWVRIVEWAGNGGLDGALVEGPLALDLCLSREAARIKGYSGEVAGDADIIVVPNITVGNAAAKAFFLTGAIAGGVVVGASSPIVALSRSDSVRTRLCSLALASLLYKEGLQPNRDRG